MDSFYYLPDDVLEKLSFDVLDTKYIYKDRHSLVGKLFWSRLTTTIDYIYNNNIGGDVLEFGCGSGLIMPTLSRTFKRVVGVDLNIRDAVIIKDIMVLDNVELVQDNILNYNSTTKFDLIIANDVMEHILDISTVIDHLNSLLINGGHIIISVPTESMLYRFARLMLNVKKPTDHYHTADSIIKKMKDYFTTKDIKYLPVNRLKALSFFAVYVGRKQ